MPLFWLRPESAAGVLCMESPHQSITWHVEAVAGAQAQLGPSALAHALCREVERLAANLHGTFANPITYKLQLFSLLRPDPLEF